MGRLHLFNALNLLLLVHPESLTPVSSDGHKQHIYEVRSFDSSLDTWDRRREEETQMTT